MEKIFFYPVFVCYFFSDKIAGAHKKERNCHTADQEKLLCMTIPYSSGWRAYIDGVETEILKADTMYMAVDVPEGTHQIEFYYCTPYLKTGAGLSGLGILSVIGIVIFRYRNGRKKQKEME